MSASSLSAAASSVMSAVVCAKYGSVKEDGVIVVRHDLTIPTISHPDQVLVKVMAAGLNAMDTSFINGYFSAFGDNFWCVRNPPFVTAFDVAGVAIAVGSEVKHIKVGDKVYGHADWKGQGAAAQFAVVTSDHLSVFPSNLSFAEAAGVPIAGVTAYQAVLQHACVTATDRVLILGGSSGCGTFALQMCRSSKVKCAYLATTCSASSEAFVRGIMGANEQLQVIDYRSTTDWSTQFADEASKLDVVIDCVGGAEEWQRAKRSLKPKTGRFITICGEGRGPEGHNAERANETIKYKGITQYGDVAALDAVSTVLRDGSVRVILDKVYPMEEGKTAFERMEAKNAKGKIVIELNHE